VVVLRPSVGTATDKIASSDEVTVGAVSETEREGVVSGSAGSPDGSAKNPTEPVAVSDPIFSSKLLKPESVRIWATVADNATVRVMSVEDGRIFTVDVEIQVISLLISFTTAQRCDVTKIYALSQSQVENGLSAEQLQLASLLIRIDPFPTTPQYDQCVHPSAGRVFPNGCKLLV